MAIHERREERKGAAWVEVSRDGVETLYLLMPDRAAECRAEPNEDARWECAKDCAFAWRKRKGEGA